MAVFAKYLAAKCAKKNRETAYRTYLTDALRVIGENTSKYGGGSYLEARWADMALPKKEETRTAGEIIEHMKKRLEEVS